VANVTQAQLVARADGSQFTFSVVNNTSQVSGLDPLQAQFPTSSRYAARTLIGWAFRYRTRKVVSLGLVVPTGWSSAAQQLALNAAWGAMDSIDMRMGTLGVPYQGLTGQPSAPQFVPGGGTTPDS
jgi:hypothetical protein